MKTNNNSTNNIQNLIKIIGSIAIFIFTIISALWIGREIGKAGSKLIEKFIKLIDKIFERKAEEAKAKKQAEAIKAAEPILKQSIKNVKPIKFADLEKTMGSVNKIVDDSIDQSTIKEMIDEDQVPNNIREKIEKEEAQKASGTKTIINGKIYDNRDQLIYELRQIKKSKIGAHRADDFAKSVKIKMNKMLEDAKNKSNFKRLDAIFLTSEFINRLNAYIEYFKVDTTEISFEETDSIIDKYFPMEV